MNAVELITKAADLIETKGWTQGCNARNAAGERVYVDTPDAACFCVYGALAKCVEQELLGQLNDIAAAELSKYVSREFGELDGRSGQNIVNYNDTPGRTKEEVLAVMRAVAKELTS